MNGNLHPVCQVIVLRKPFRSNQDPSFHRTTGNVKDPGVTFLQCLIGLVRIDPNDHFLAMHTAAHVAVQQECYPAEHLLLDKSLPFAKGFPDPVCKFDVKGHRVFLLSRVTCPNTFGEQGAPVV